MPNGDNDYEEVSRWTYQRINAEPEAWVKFRNDHIGRSLVQLSENARILGETLLSGTLNDQLNHELVVMGTTNIIHQQACQVNNIVQDEVLRISTERVKEVLNDRAAKKEAGIDPDADPGSQMISEIDNFLRDYGGDTEH